MEDLEKTSGHQQKKVSFGPFDVVFDDGVVMVRSVGGFELKYPKGSMMNAHIFQFIEDGDVKTIEMIVHLHYLLCTVVIDEKLFCDILDSVDSYIRRNKADINDEDDEEILKSEEEGYRFMEEARKSLVKDYGDGE